MLAAGALVIGLSASAAGAGRAQASVRQAATGAVPAAVQIPANTFVEIWMPYITPNRPHCLDATNPGGGLGYPPLSFPTQIYNCHASDGHGDNQLWEFINLGNGSYWIVNKYHSGQCLAAYDRLHPAVSSCTADAAAEWQVINSAYDPSGFELSNDQWGECLSADGIPPSQGSGGIRLFGCYNPPFFNEDVQIQTWELG